MFGLPRRATYLWLLVVGLAALTLLYSAATATWAPNLLGAALLFAVAGGIAEHFAVMVPTSRPGHVTRTTVSSAISVAATLALPFPFGVLAVALAWLIAPGKSPAKRAYNMGQATLSAAAAGLVWHMAANRSLIDPRNGPFILAVPIAYFAANTVLVAGIVAFASGLPVQLTWIRTYRHIWPASLGLVFSGVLLAELWTVSPWTLALAAIPLTGLYYALRNTVSLETNTVDALFQLADILDARDAYTHGHSLRVGQYAEKLALELGLSGDEAHLIFLAGRLHDIGKCAIRNEVLLKAGALDDEERSHMCIHPGVGGAMLESFSLFRECAKYVRGHHERWDGKGYPDGLQGERIPIGARIIAVADSFDAMTTTRPYRKALPLAEARRRLAESSGTQWDPRVITAFLGLLDKTPLGQPEPVALPVGTGNQQAAA